MSETVQPRKDQMRTVSTNYIIPPVRVRPFILGQHRNIRNSLQT